MNEYDVLKLNTALRYISEGFSVLPIFVIDGTIDIGFGIETKEKSTAIEYWTGEFLGAQIGISVGPQSQLCIFRVYPYSPDDDTSEGYENYIGRLRSAGAGTPYFKGDDADIFLFNTDSGDDVPGWTPLPTCTIEGNGGLIVPPMIIDPSRREVPNYWGEWYGLEIFERGAFKRLPQIVKDEIADSREDFPELIEEKIHNGYLTLYNRRAIPHACSQEVEQRIGKREKNAFLG